MEAEEKWVEKEYVESIGNVKTEEWLAEIKKKPYVASIQADDSSKFEWIVFTASKFIRKIHLKTSN